MRRFPDSPAQKPARRAVASALSIAGASAGVALAGAVLAVLFVPDLGELALDSPLAVVRSGAQAMTKQQQLRVESLDELRKTVFFDAVTHKPRVWYAISPTGELELFISPGRHPDRPETLKPVTASLVQQLERRLKAQQQERAAEAERRAATARADAEIAEAHRAQVSASAAPVQPQLRRPTAPVSASAAPVQPEPQWSRPPAPVSASAEPVQREEQSGKATAPAGTVAAREVPVLEAPPPSTSPRRSEAPMMSSASPPLPTTSRRDGATFGDAPGRPSVTPRTDLYDDAPVNEEAARAKQYNELVSDARALIDAGRYGEARARAQRAIFVDPRRMAARTLWAEAQTKLDQSSPSAFARRPPRPHWSY